MTQEQQPVRDPRQHLLVQPATAAVGAAISETPIVRPAKANKPIPNTNIRARFMEIS
jgi:hypothetical protein